MTSETGADLITVNNTSQTILPNAELSGRKLFSIRNSSTGAQVITIYPANNRSVTALSGIVLSVGQTYVESNSEGFECWQGQVQAIASAIGGQVSIFER